MTEVYQNSLCGQCGDELDEAPSTAIGARESCPSCGSLVRSFHVKISDKIEMYNLIKLQHKELGQKKPKTEITSGDDLHRDSGRWMNLERILDRGKNWYEETITDILTGKITHHVAHPLDQHTGHGTAKYKKMIIEDR